MAPKLLCPHLFFMDFLNRSLSFVEAVSNLIAIPGVILTVYLFFDDPIRRWKFFGYRPTLVIVLFDPVTKRVLLEQTKSKWNFVQGGLYGSDIYTALEQIIERELGTTSNVYKLQFVKPMGTVEINDGRTRRATLGGLSLRKTLKGKGYLACFVLCNLEKTIKKVKKGYGVKRVQLFNLEDAFAKIQASQFPQKKAKTRIIKKIIDELENLK